MKILHLGKYYPPAPGGIESHVQTLARCQKQLGHEVSVICVNHADSNGVDVTSFNLKRTRSLICDDNGVSVIRKGKLLSLNRFDLSPALVGCIRNATRFADIIHLHTPNPLMIIVWVVVADKSKPLVITHHSDIVKQRFLRHLVAPFEKFAYRNSKLILTTSANYLDGSPLLKSYAQKTRPLPLAINLEPFVKPTQEAINNCAIIRSKFGSPLWLMVGRLTYYKGHAVALEALTRVPGKLIVIGKGSLETSLKTKARSLGIDGRIEWIPAVSDLELSAYYQSATALWFPSIAKSEGFGLVQVEAMASGCPVINTEIPGSGVSWVCPNGISGITVGIHDADGLANAALRLLKEKGLRERLGRNARQRAIEEFDCRLMAERSLVFYRSCLGSNN